MKIVKIIVVTVLVIIGFVLIIGVMSPSEVGIERSISINATPSSIFEEINSVKATKAWDYWSKIDPENTTYEFSGPDSGVGSKASWKSDNRDVGNGTQEIIESVKDQKVRQILTFEGFDHPGYADLVLSQDGDACKVTWTFEGNMGSNPLYKLMGLFMDGTLGPQYEEGLSSLKELVENKPTFSVDISVIDAQPITYLGIKENFDMTDLESIGPKMGAIYGKIGNHMGKNSIEMAGPPFTVHLAITETNWEAIVSMPVSSEVTEGDGEIEVGATDGGKTVKAVHMGDYYKLNDTYEEAKKYMEYKNLTVSGNAYEIYVTDPAQVPDTAQWVTEVYYPVN